MTPDQLLPEWAPVSHVCLAWPYSGSDWDANLPEAQACYWQMLETLSAKVELVVLLHPSLSLADFKETLDVKGLSERAISVYNDIAYNDTWIRDYGPLSTGSGLLTFGFNGWGGKFLATDDNQAAKAIAEKLNLPIKSFDFILEGGAIETNGEYLLLNADCVVDEKRNQGVNLDEVEDFLDEQLATGNILWLHDICLTGDDTDGHIDTIARFSPNNTIVVSGRNADHPDADVLDLLCEQVSQIGQLINYQVMELPSPVVSSAVDGRMLPATYANFLIVNDTVFAPIYGLDSDSKAIEVLQAAFPNHQVQPIRCEALLEQHGSLHCATMQIAQQF